jgi:hypothetical protein
VQHECVPVVMRYRDVLIVSCTSLSEVNCCGVEMHFDAMLMQVI